MKFEGDEVTGFEAQLPSITVEAPESYERGSVIRLAVEVRVKSVTFDEDKTGRLVRRHKFEIRDIQVVSSFDEGQDVSAVTGSATSQATQTPEQAADVGVQIERTGGTWPNQLAGQREEVPVG